MSTETRAPQAKGAQSIDSQSDWACLGCGCTRAEWGGGHFGYCRRHAGKCHCNDFGFAAVLTPAAPPKPAGRFPPMKGDVWRTHPSNGETEWEMTGLRHARYPDMWAADPVDPASKTPKGVGAWLDRSFTDGTLTFVRYGTPPEDAREAPKCCDACAVGAPCAKQPALATPADFAKLKPDMFVDPYAKQRAAMEINLERGKGIAALSLPPARVQFVPRIDEWDLLPNVGEYGTRKP